MSEDLEILALKERLSAFLKKKENKKQNSEGTQKSEANTQIQAPNTSENLTSDPKTETEETQVTAPNQSIPQILDANSTVPPSSPADASKASEPSYSIYVGNLSQKTKKELLEEHFNCCGTIKRLTMVTDYYTHVFKGFAYIEFETKEAYDNALTLNNTLLLGNTIEVKPKRDKVPRKPIRRRISRRFRRS